MKLYALYYAREELILAVSHDRQKVERYQRIHRLRNTTDIFTATDEEIAELYPTVDFDDLTLINLPDRPLFAELAEMTQLEKQVLGIVSNNGGNTDPSRNILAAMNQLSDMLNEKNPLRPLKRKERKLIKKTYKYLQRLLSDLNEVYTKSTMYTVAHAKPSDGRCYLESLRNIVRTYLVPK